jgi:hypothetical protein
VTGFGCPDTTNGCDYYTYGTYPSGITVKKAGGSGNVNGFAVFGPGVYYVTGGMSFDSNSCVRPAIGAPDPTGIGGTMFYFSGANSLSVDANSGSKCPVSSPFTTSLEKCTPSSQIPSNIPSSLDGNVLLAPCSGTYGDPLGTSDPIGEQRGILFFQNRSTSTGASPSYGGGGSMLSAGAMYFHQCVATGGVDTGGVGCPSSAFNTSLSFNGNPGSSTYVLGYIVADEIILKGNSSIFMNLNPAATYNIIKVGLFR